MNLKSCNNVAANRYQLEVEVDAQAFEDALNRAYLKDKKNITLPGFRKGKAPRAFIEKYYGEKVFYEDAINDIYPVALDEAIEEAKLDVIEDKIDFEIVEVGKSGLIFKATVTTKPEVNLSGYKGLKITPKSTEVTEEDIDANVNEILDRHSRMVTMERPAQNDDIVVIDFEGFVAGVPFEGGKAENYSLTLGTKMFIPGFEDQLIGHSTGEDVDVNVSFPEEYHASELAGQPALFKVHIHEVKGKEFPEFDDEFVKDISEFNTVEELRDDIRKHLEESRKKEVADDIDDQLMVQVNELLEGEIPEAMYEKQIDSEIRALNYSLQNKGLRFDTYMQLTGQNPQNLRQNLRAQAERQVKIRLALEKIGQLENLTATDEEIEEEFENLAKIYKQDVDKIKGMISKEGQIKDIIARKAMNLVRDSAVVEGGEEAAAQKKTPAKKAEPKKAEDKKEEPKKAEAKKETAKKAEPKKAEDKKEEPKKAEAKKETAKKEEPKKEAAKKPSAKKPSSKKAE